MQEQTSIQCFKTKASNINITTIRPLYTFIDSFKQLSMQEISFNIDPNFNTISFP